MENLLFNTYPVDVIKRPKRRTVQIRITVNNDISLLVPSHFTNYHIQECLAKYSNWLEKKIKANLLLPKKPLFLCQDNDEINYLGEPYTLKLAYGKRVKATFNEKTLIFTSPHISESQEDKKKRLAKFESWMKEQARQIIEDRVYIFAKEMGVTYNQIRFKRQKTCWGSCSSKKNLNFNYLLIMAPLTIIDYVVIHECAHLIHMNHSAEFWSVVERYYPNYKKAKLWLKKNGHLLTLLS